MNAYWIMGDSEHALVRRTEPPKERTWEQSAELMPEIGHEAAFVRNYPGWPSWLGYVCTPNDDRKIKFAIADAITSFDAELGASVLVSESAAHKLQPYLQGQAEFHPAKINGGVPQPYHLLWTRNVIDALDYERSRLAPVEYLARDGVVPLRLVQAEFQANKIRDQMVFRRTRPADTDIAQGLCHGGVLAPCEELEDFGLSLLPQSRRKAPGAGEAGSKAPRRMRVRVAGAAVSLGRSSPNLSRALPQCHPMQPAQPIAFWTAEEAECLDVFLLREEGPQETMDPSMIDGILCAFASGPRLIAPTEEMRWVWDSEQGLDEPVFRDQAEASTIMGLLLQQWNAINDALTHEPETYEPWLLERTVEGRPVSAIDEWRCGYCKGISLDNAGWAPLLVGGPACTLACVCERGGDNGC